VGVGGGWVGGKSLPFLPFDGGDAGHQKEGKTLIELVRKKICEGALRRGGRQEVQRVRERGR